MHLKSNNWLHNIVFRVIVISVFATLAAACSGTGIVNLVSKSYDVSHIESLSYGNQARASFDLYLPKQANSQGETTPVVIFFYGGSWNRGEKSEYQFVGRRLASEGYIVAIPNYRVYPEVRYPDFLWDCAQATAAVLEHLQTPQFAQHAPAQKIYLMGHSAGAYNAAMLSYAPQYLNKVGLGPDTIAGFIGLAGPYDLYPIKVEEVKPVFHHPNYPSDSNPIELMEGAPRVPALLLAPETDNLVSIKRNTLAFADTLESDQRSVQVETIKGTDHVTLIGTFSPLLFWKQSAVAPVLRFIDDQFP